MDEDNKRKKKSRRMKERKETTLLVDKLLSLKNIASAVSITPIFLVGEWGTRNDDYELPKYKKIMLLKFLDINSSGRTNCPTCGTCNRSPPF